MAIRHHLKLLKKGTSAWNTWRHKHRDTQPNFSGADLREAKLNGADLRAANLCGANLVMANLSGADLREAKLK